MSPVASLWTRWRGLLIVTAIYLLAAVMMWWRLWSGGASSTATCACGDPGLAMWSFGSVARSITHFQNPFFTTQLFHPQGVNLLDNTSVIFLGVVFAPVTIAAGPVFSVNLALTLAPVATGLGAYCALRLMTRHRFAAGLGGLLYGFSPFIVSNQLPFAHLNLSYLFVPPLVLACLHRIIVVQRGFPLYWGLALGILLTVQFFISTEVLVMMLLIGTIGCVVLIAGALIRRPESVRVRVYFAVRALAVAVGVCSVLLGYPLWFALFGARHTSGLVWPGIPISGNSWRNFLFADPASFGSPSGGELALGGYFGAAGPPDPYLGFGFLAFLALTFFLCIRVRMVWFMGVMLAVTSALSLGILWLPFGSSGPGWLPWRMVRYMPIVENISPDHLGAIGDLLAAVIFAIGLDRLLVGRRGGIRWLGELLDRAGKASRLVLATCAAAIVLVPIAASYSLPFVVTKVAVPQWFSTKAKTLPAGSVVMTMPYPASGLSQAMAWQAIDNMSFALAGGYGLVPGPNGQVDHFDDPGSADFILSDLSYGIGTDPTGTATEIAAVRKALGTWGVTQVVVTDQGRNPSYELAFITAVMGTLPTHRYGVWSWDRVDRVNIGGGFSVPPPALDKCGDYSANETVTADSVPGCVISHGTALGAHT